MAGLKGFPDAINTVYPKARIQLCIVHMVRNSRRFVSWKDYKAVTRDLKAIYQAPTEEAGPQALEAFAAAWDRRYPQISRSWQANWLNLATFLAYPTDIRKVIYTTNAIESLNSVLRHAIKKRKVFPTDDSVKKVVWLAIQSASQKWTMPLKDWRIAMSRFIVHRTPQLGWGFRKAFSFEPVIKTPFDLLKHLAVWQLQVSNKKSKGGPNGERKELSAHPMEL